MYLEDTYSSNVNTNRDGQLFHLLKYTKMRHAPVKFVNTTTSFICNRQPCYYIADMLRFRDTRLTDTNLRTLDRLLDLRGLTTLVAGLLTTFLQTVDNK